MGYMLFIGLPAALIFMFWWIYHWDIQGIYLAATLNEMDPRRIGAPDLSNASPTLKALFNTAPGPKGVQ